MTCLCSLLVSTLALCAFGALAQTNPAHGLCAANEETVFSCALQGSTKTVSLGLALFIGLGPLFILCLIFKQTESLFHKWLLYGIGLMFAMAVLSFMVSLVLELSLRLAAGLWASSAITSFLQVGGSAGLTSQAMLQGVIGTLLTVLLITAPAAAAQFFGGTLGQFYSQSMLTGGASGRQGPGGEALGTYPQQASGTGSTAPADRANTGGGLGNNSGGASRTTSNTPPTDSIDTSRATPPPLALNVDGG